MPSSTFAALSVDGSAVSDHDLAAAAANGVVTAADAANDLSSQWRPDTPERAASPTQSSPLLGWVRKQQALFQQEEAQRRLEQEQRQQEQQQQEQQHEQHQQPQQAQESQQAQPAKQTKHKKHRANGHMPAPHRESESRRSSGAFRLTMATRSGSIRLQRTRGNGNAGGAAPTVAPASAGEGGVATTPTGAAGAGAFQSVPLTRDEFEALPLAIQRKYFSTLERLRFAQPSIPFVDGPALPRDDSPRHALKRRKARQDRSASDNFGNRLRRRSLRESQFAADPLWFDSLPDKIKKRQFTREEQVVLAKHLRASVILDAADEAIYKVGRRASRNLSPDIELFTPTLSSRRNSMDSIESEKQPREPSVETSAPDSFLESFRWLDDEDDLDLRLFLDDYHANLREDVPSPTDKRRPSFRRHLSISKIPFGRSSLSHSRPATMTKAVVSPPASPIFYTPSRNLSTDLQHARRRSRTLSLMGNKLGATESVTAIDPAAAHYQDPEARLKLRVYLASPQKFDEAIEFGFPSVDALAGAPASRDAASPLKHRPREKSSDLSSTLRTFLADDDDDDKMSLNSDPASAADPDSPKTPDAYEKPTALPRLHPIRASSDPITATPSSTKPALVDGGYAQMPASSREMTLRMTLTRPDLRACEDQIYGWQKPPALYHPSRRSQSSPLRDELMMPTTTYIGDGIPKQSMDRAFVGVDHWNTNGDGGLVKRIWNRVRRV